MKRYVLFDLGGTLVEYFDRPQFPGILREAIAGVRDCLRAEGLLRVSEEEMWQRVEAENHEASDYRVRPTEERLSRIFQLDGSPHPTHPVCRVFMRPIFARGRIYDDTVPVLSTLRERGITTAIVSNTTWGSPAELWREEVARHGLDRVADELVFCRDVGWRKPDRRVFEHTLDLLRARVDECVFVGDDPRWDLAGPRAIGMRAILIGRRETPQHSDENPIRGLNELVPLLEG